MFCVHGEEYFHGQPQAAEDPLNAGLGLVQQQRAKPWSPAQETAVLRVTPLHT